MVPIAILRAASDSVNARVCVFGLPTLQARVCNKRDWAWPRDQVWMLCRLEEEGSGGTTHGDWTRHVVSVCDVTLLHIALLCQYNVILIVALCWPVIDLDLDLALFGRVFSLVVLGYDRWGKLGLHYTCNHLR